MMNTLQQRLSAVPSWLWEGAGNALQISYLMDVQRKHIKNLLKCLSECGLADAWRNQALKQYKLGKISVTSISTARLEKIYVT